VTTMWSSGFVTSVNRDSTKRGANLKLRTCSKNLFRVFDVFFSSWNYSSLFNIILFYNLCHDSILYLYSLLVLRTSHTIFWILIKATSFIKDEIAIWTTMTHVKN
jgi:hypothetical protein